MVHVDSSRFKALGDDLSGDLIFIIENKKKGSSILLMKNPKETTCEIITKASYHACKIMQRNFKFICLMILGCQKGTCFTQPLN